MLKNSSLLLACAALAFSGLAGTALAQTPVVVPTGDATALANALIGPGIKLVGTPTYVGSPSQSGTFSGAGVNSVGFSNGILLTTGLAASAGFPYTAPDSPDSAVGTSGDSGLNAIVYPSTTFDAAVLEFSFTSTAPTVYFSYTFASAEYPNYINKFNDVFAFYVNRVNYATIPGTTIPVSINTVNAGANAAFFKGYNQIGALLPYGGQTKVLSFQAPVNTTGVNTIRLAIADTRDANLDSAVFIQGGSLTTSPVPVPTGGTITTACPLPAGVINTPYGPVPFSQTGLLGTPTWTISAGALPTGINFDNMGVALGVPTTTGTFQFTVQATGASAQGVSAIASKQCSVTINNPVIPQPPPPPPLIITTSCPMPPATVGSSYQAGLSASGGGMLISFSIAGSLPPGLFLDNNTVRGTPTTAGNYTFGLKVADQSLGCSIMVNATSLVLSGCPLPNGSVGAVYSSRAGPSRGPPPRQERMALLCVAPTLQA
jgi:hypothetical protein